MCAILGFISPNPTPEAVNTLKRLFIESKVRGMHAYGFSALDDQPVTEKSNLLKPLLDKIRKPKALIGHCRYSTSGDYLDMKNNQPLQYGDESLVFNGVIDMGTKAEMEARHQIKMNCENDGEIMLQSSDREGLLATNISFAGLTLSKDKITFMRNENRPAYMAKKHGAIYIGSTADILRRCLLNPEPLEPFKVYEWAL